MLLKSRLSIYKRKFIFNPVAFLSIPKDQLFCLLGIMLIGILVLYSAAKGNIRPWAIKHIIYTIFSIPLIILVSSINLKIIKTFANVFFIFTILLLIAVFIVGDKAMGATRWIKLFGLKFQPSEIAKLSVVIIMAKYFHNINKTQNVKNKILKEILIPFIIISPIICLIILQPDLATAGVTLILFLTILFMAGINFKFFIFGGLISILSMPLIWLKLKKYQKLRIVNFFNPDNDPLGSGYNIIQSKIAIGSGGFSGLGFLNGTQGQLKFLPEHHTDFIFTIIGEEFGFIGSIITISLYLYIIRYGYYVTFKAKSIFGKILAFGSTNIIFIHAFINTAMTLGLVPVAGIPLPFISYGGTMFFVAAICFALIVNVDINHDIEL